MNALWGALIGGGISLATTLVVDLLRSRRELQHRWDATALAAIEHVVEVANRTIGALYDEGRARAAATDPATVAALDRAARTNMDAFRVAHARARLTAPMLQREFAAYADAMLALKVCADNGFPGEEQWKELQRDLSVALDTLIAAATERLRLRTA